MSPCYHTDQYNMKSDITWSDLGPQFVGSITVQYLQKHTALVYFEAQDIDAVKILQLCVLLQWAKENHDNLKPKKLTDFFL